MVLQPKFISLKFIDVFRTGKKKEVAAILLTPCFVCIFPCFIYFDIYVFSIYSLFHL